MQLRSSALVALALGLVVVSSFARSARAAKEEPNDTPMATKEVPTPPIAKDVPRPEDTSTRRVALEMSTYTDSGPPDRITAVGRNFSIAANSTSQA